MFFNSLKCESIQAPSSPHRFESRLLNYKRLYNSLYSRTVPIQGSLIPCKRYGHSAVMYGNSMYIFAGARGFNLNEMYGFDFSTFQWFEVKMRGTVPHVRCNHTATMYNGKMYVFGGYGNSGALYNDLYEFCFKNFTWKKLKPKGHIPCERSLHSAVLRNDCIIVYGGYYQKTDSLMSFSIRECKWTPLNSTGQVPKHRWGHSAVLHGDTMWIFGGKDDYQYFHHLYALDLVLLQWKRFDLPNSPRNRYKHTAVLRGDTMIVFGGLEDGTIERYTNDLFFFDCRLLEWKKPEVEGVLPTKRYFHSALLNGNSMYIFGGQGGPHYNDLCEIFLGNGNAFVTMEHVQKALRFADVKLEYASEL